MLKVTTVQVVPIGKQRSLSFAPRKRLESLSTGTKKISLKKTTVAYKERPRLAASVLIATIVNATMVRRYMSMIGGIAPCLQQTRRVSTLLTLYGGRRLSRFLRIMALAQERFMTTPTMGAV
jgi:hypothetical protein